MQYACFHTCVPVYTRGVHLRFDDLRDAAEGKQILEQHGFQVEYVTGYQYALVKAQETSLVNDFEGQMQLAVMIDANPEHAVWDFTHADVCYMQLAVHNIASAFGKVRNLVHVETDSKKMTLTFRLEYHSVDACNRAVNSLRIDPVWGTNSEVSHPLLPCLPFMLTFTQKSFQWVTVDAAHWYTNLATISPGRPLPRVDNKGRFPQFRAADGTDGYYPGGPYTRHPSDQHNRVRRERILDGSDVRTTIMLRNIPNKMDWVCHILPHSSTFANLAIDGSQGCPR